MQKSSVKAESKTVYFIKQKSVVKVLGNSCGSRRELCGKSSPRGLYDIPGRESPRVQKVDSGGTRGCNRTHGLVIITKTHYQGGRWRLLKSRQPKLTTLLLYLHITFYGKLKNLRKMLPLIVFTPCLDDGFLLHVTCFKSENTLWLLKDPLHSRHQKKVKERKRRKRKERRKNGRGSCFCVCKQNQLWREKTWYFNLRKSIFPGSNRQP